MPAKIAILIAQKLADERTRKIIITIVAVVLSIIFLLVAGLQVIIALFTITLSTFLTEDTSLVGQTVALMDEARDAYVDEQMAEYRQRTDRNGNEYRNVILQWENGFSNNDKEVLTIVSCYYEQDWETDMSALACWVALKSVSFSTRERGPYSCGGCMSRKVCDGHPDGNGGTYHHSDDSADCDNSHTESYCPGDHYDLYVTARLPGCENWNGESGATEQTVAQWEELCSPSYTGESEVMEQYLQELQAATLNDDWEGWSEVNIEWTKVLYQTDWEDLYGVTVTQVGITNTDSFTPSEDYTGGITGIADKENCTETAVIENAIRYYKDYLYMQTDGAFINESVKRTFLASVNLMETRLNNRTNKVLSELAIQQAIICQVLAHELEINPRALDNYRRAAVEYLKMNDRVFRLEDILEE